MNNLVFTADCDNNVNLPTSTQKKAGQGIDTRVSAYKRDADGNNVKDAVLEVVTSDKKTRIEKWTTDGKVHYVNGLTADTTYYLHEISAPVGYVLNPDYVEFKTGLNGDRAVTMKNYQTTFIKKDAKGNTVSGAEMKVYKTSDYKAGNTADKYVVDKWETDSEEHIIKNLVGGVSYTIVETKTPTGYVTMPNYVFIASYTKNEQLTGKDTVVYIEKVDEAGNGIKGVKIAVYNKSDLTVKDDKTYTVKSGAKPVYSWITGGNVHCLN